MQKKNRKGFTLIELLAVIVILAIIALIAVPVIMNVIIKARVSAFEDSAYGIVKAGEMYYTNKLLDAEGMTGDKEFIVVGNVFKNSEGKTLDISGSIPSSGKITVTSEGKVALAISNGEYCIRKATTESKVKAEKLSDIGNNCDYKKETATPNSVFTTATGETSIPACIADNTECTAEAIKDGLKVGVKVNDSETKDFYVIKDEGSTLTLIMDRNIDSTTVAWYADADNSKGPLTALAYLESQTAGWSNIPEETYTLSDTYNTSPMYTGVTRTDARARLLTMTEASELGCTTSSGSCPTWLYGNLSSSEAPYGYWTSSADDFYSVSAWTVNFDGGTIALDVNDYGGTNDNYVTNVRDFGIRPVITISKTVL